MEKWLRLMTLVSFASMSLSLMGEEASNDDNLLKNGGIDGQAPWSSASGSNDAQFSIDEKEGARKPGSLCIDKPAGGSGAENWTQGVDAPADKPCRVEVTAMVKAVGMQPGAEACVMVQCWGERAQAENYAWSDRVREDCDWKSVRAVFEVPAATKNIRVRAYLSGQGKVFFDDLRMVVTDAELTQAPSATPPPEGRMETLARGCAGEIPWRFDAIAAMKEAKAKKLPLLVYVRCTDSEDGLASARESIAATKIPFSDDGMRKDVLFRCGPFADADVQTLATESFVPLVITYLLSSSGRGFGAESGKNDPLAFLGTDCQDVVTPALIAASPNGKIAGKLHRLGTLSGDLVDLWMTGMLDRVGARGRADKADDDESESSKIAAARQMIRRGEVDEASAALTGIESAPAALARARVGLRRGDWQAALAECESGLQLIEKAKAEGETQEPAASAAAQATSEELMFWRGWCLFFLARHDEAFPLWKSLVSESRIGRKAAACCLEGGPRLWLSETTRLWPRERELPTQSEVDTVEDFDPLKSILTLLELQMPDGAFLDHNAFTRDNRATSIVMPAITAIAAQALRRWQSDLPEPIASDVKDAITRADRMLEEYAAASPPGGDVFASPYVLEELLIAGKLEAAAMMVKRIASQQMADGNWTVYTPDRPASFNTALAVLALVHARDAGVEVPADTIKRGATALAAMRQDGGLFPYSTKSGHEWMTTPHGSIARDPLCEQALIVAGGGAKKSLEAALTRYIEFHEELRPPTKKFYDYFNMRGHGGYYFFFAHMNAVRATAHSSPAARKKTFQIARAAVLRAREGDGAFVDQFMIGRTYGTAAALWILAETRP